MPGRCSWELELSGGREQPLRSCRKPVEGLAVEGAEKSWEWWRTEAGPIKRRQVKQWGWVLSVDMESQRGTEDLEEKSPGWRALS